MMLLLDTLEEKLCFSRWRNKIVTNNINEQLLLHFTNGEGAARYLRYRIPGWVSSLRRFMGARSDTRRLQEAEKIAGLILNMHDFWDILRLRDEVANLELKLFIKYINQKDHTAHTVYLFLLGIWIFDHSEKVNEAVSAKIKGINDNDSIQGKISRFVFVWIFASLLHDIGYLFYEMKKESDSALKVYNDMFKEEWIVNYSYVDEDQITEVKKLYKKFEKFKIPQIGYLNTPSEVIEQLRNIPWIQEFCEQESTDGLEILKHKTIDPENLLIIFALDVAKNGYPCKEITEQEPKVDHGIASGLMLLQYTSMWYWLYQECDKNLREKIFKRYKYDGDFFVDYVIPACQATVYHNLPKKLIPKLDINQAPFLYLAILCDELQLWDRFPAAEENLDIWKNFQIMAEDISIDTIVDRKGRLRIAITCQQSIKDKITDALDGRLSKWETIVSINQINEFYMNS